MTTHGGRAQVIPLEPRALVEPHGRSPFVATPRWVQERYRTGEITATDLAVYASLATFANAARLAHPSQAALAARAGKPLRTVSRSLGKLRDTRCIGSGRRGQGRSNLYLLPWNDPREISTDTELDTPPVAYETPPADFDTPPVAHLDTPPVAYRTRTNELEPDQVVSQSAQGGGHARAREPRYVQQPLMTPQASESDALTRGSPPTPAPMLLSPPADRGREGRDSVAAQTREGDR